MKTLRVLAVGAHPDDLEILCGGTLAKYAQNGHTVIMLHLLKGDKGHYRMDSERLAKMRKKEARAAGAVIGAEVRTLGLPDGELFSTPETRRAVTDLVREARPDVVLTHGPDDYMADHSATSELVRDATFFCAAPLFKTRNAAHEKIVPLFFMDTLAGLRFQPTEYVDISETFDKKKEMLGRHQSQVEWLREHDGVDILESLEIVGRFRGMQCGARYAEGFRPHGVWGRMVTRRLLP